MPQAVVLPKLGQTMEEAAIVKWLKKEGDAVKKGDVLFEMETDKANLEVESFFEGTLLKVLVGAGQALPVNTVVAYVGAPGEAIPATPPPVAAAAPAAVAPAAASATPPAAPKAQPAPTVALSAPAAPMPRAPVPKVPAPAAAAPKRLVISPRAKALAKTSAIDPSGIAGSGPNGRITEKDVQAHMERHGYAALRVSPAAKRLAVEKGVDVLTVRGTGDGARIMTHDVERAIAERPKPMSRMRQTIARRLTESFMTIPHFYVTVTADMTELLKYRQQLKELGKAYTVTDFILEAVVMTLVEMPTVNSSTDGESVRWRGSVDLGVAVSLEQGLVVPVIRDAQTLSLAELSAQAKALAAKAREGKLLPDEMTGGSFTVSNMGMLDVDNFNAIINPGEAAILAVATTREQPAVVGGQVKIRSMMKMTLSVDHRIVDGATGAAFVNGVKKKLEDLELWKSLT
jgi:pyruvate dehydrogenase E2 component (dihydrolipoamide acetyltransferase)